MYRKILYISFAWIVLHAPPAHAGGVGVAGSALLHSSGILMTVPKGHCAYARSEHPQAHWPDRPCKRQCDYCRQHWPIPNKPHIRLKLTRAVRLG